MICRDVTEIYKIISSMTEVGRDQLFTVPFRDIRSHQIKLVMVVPHTSGTRPVQILAKDTVNGRSLYKFRGEVLGRMIHEELLNKQTIKHSGNPLSLKQ